MSKLPRVILWAWERPEDLSFIEPREVGVAFLAETIYVRGGDFQIRPRLQPLRVPEGTKLIAVARIETGGQYSLASATKSERQAFSNELAGQVAAAISRLHEIPGVVAIQVDFDATTSERAFYAEILRELRSQLSHEVPISITALASWCIGDPWIAGLPVDQAVPMLFRMGPETTEVRRYLSTGRDYRLAVCRGSAGISTDETAPPIRAGRQIFIFHPRPWTPSAAALAFSEVQR
jgi:hypothetical protein